MTSHILITAPLLLAAMAQGQAQPLVNLPIETGFWTNEDQKCASTRYGYLFDGRRWGALYFYGPGGRMGPVAELRPITAIRPVADGFVDMQFGGRDGAGFFRVKARGKDRAIYRVGAPHRETIQILDEQLIRCSFSSLSPAMKAAITRAAPALAKSR